jgi:hypothetical protein
MKVLEDLLDNVILKYTLLPLGMSLIFWGALLIFFGNDILSVIADYSKTLPYGDVISGFINSAGWIFLIVLYYLLSISTLGVFSSLFIDKIVLRINEKHFSCTPRKTTFKDTLYGLWISIKAFLIYIFLSIFTFWMLFIPVVNIFYQMFMWSILNKKPLVFDSSYLFFNPKEIEKELGIKAWLVVFLTSVVYFVPVVSWFGYTIQLIFMSHMVLKRCNK